MINPLRFSSVFIIFSGIYLSLLYIFDSKVSVRAPLILIILSLLMCSYRLCRGDITYLTGIMLVFFAAPVAPLMMYFIYDEVNWGWTPKLIAGIDYNLNWKVAVSVAVGCLGLLAGSFLASARRITCKISVRDYIPLSMLGFNFLIMLAIALSYISAPTATIFTGEYGGDQLNTFALAINFPSAYLLSYSIFLGLLIDQGKDRTVRGLAKLKYLKLAIAYVAIFLQFMRGDREIIGLLMALMVYYVVKPLWGCNSYSEARPMIKSRFMRSLFISLIAVVAFLAIGILRFTVSHGNYDLTNLFKANPWVMALTSFAAYFNSDQSRNLLYGETYLNYFLSIPPGIITKALGIKRAIEADNNIAASLVDTGMTSGGAHVALVALQNFGIFGLFGVMIFYGYLAQRIEEHAVRARGISLFIWLNLIAAVPIWFWYGEMTAIRAVMAAIISYCTIQLSPLKTRRVHSLRNIGASDL